MIELKYRKLKIIELGDSDDNACLLFGCFTNRNELLDVFQPAGRRWRRKPGETAQAFEQRIVKDLAATQVAEPVVQG